MELRTPFLRAFSNVSTQELMAVVGRIELFRHHYSALAGAEAVAASPIFLYVFRNDREFTPFKPLYEGKPKAVSGYFSRAMEANWMALDAGNFHGDSLQTIFHEYTHLLLRRNSLFWPLWLEEGMADVYSTFEVTDKEVIIGKPPARRLRILARQPFMPLRDLLEVDHESPQYNQMEHQGIFYAQSWLLAHFLALGDNPSHRARFRQFTEALRAGQSPLSAMTNVFKVSLAQLEAQLKQYYERGNFEPIRLPVRGRTNAMTSVWTRPVPPAEMAFQLGWLLIHVNRPEDAQAWFDLAARLQPAGPYGAEGWGILAAERGQLKEALTHLERAVQAGSRNFSVHYHLGRIRLEMALQPNGILPRLPEEKARSIRIPLKQCLALQPNCAVAHNRLGFLESVQGENTSLALRHLQTAAQLEPDNCGFILMWARYALEQGRDAKAVQALEEMARQGSHPKCQRQARELLARYKQGILSGTAR
jgi:tetratricopeptide (TPR) repeat protein